MGDRFKRSLSKGTLNSKVYTVPPHTQFKVSSVYQYYPSIRWPRTRCSRTRCSILDVIQQLVSQEMEKISQIEGVWDMFSQYHRSARSQAEVSHSGTSLPFLTYFLKGLTIHNSVFWVNYFFWIEHNAETSRFRNIIGFSWRYS